jgi:hypothetical protein
LANWACARIYLVGLRQAGGDVGVEAHERVQVVIHVPEPADGDYEDFRKFLQLRLDPFLQPHWNGIPHPAAIFVWYWRQTPHVWSSAAMNWYCAMPVSFRQNVPGSPL